MGGADGPREELRKRIVGPIATVVFVPAVAFVLIASLFVVVMDPVPMVSGVAVWLAELGSVVLEWLLGFAAPLVPSPVALPVPDPVVYYAGLLILATGRGLTARVTGGVGLVLAFFLRG